MTAFSTVVLASGGKPYGPGLDYLIQVVGGGAGAFGALVGLVWPTRSVGAQMLRNFGTGLAIGGVIGTCAAFAIWIALRLNGGVG